MKGFLDFDLSPYVSLKLIRSDDELLDDSHACVVDTGLSGFLYLPEDRIAAWNLPFLSSVPVVLANRIDVIADAYECSVSWFGVPLPGAFLAGPSGCDSLVGMELLKGCRIELDVDAREVRIELL